LSILQIPTARVFKPLLGPSRYKGAYGGRGSAKSHFFADLAIDNLVQNPTHRGVCVREIQKSLKESAKRLLEDKIQTHKVGHLFNIMHDRIETTQGGVIIFQGMQDHTAESIKSLEGFDWAWCEEAQTMTSKSLELLRPTIRKPGSELWFSWNPRLASDAVDKFFRSDSPPPGAVCIRANHSDNPWFPKELKAELNFDKTHRPDRYGHVWLGEYEPQAVGAIWTMRDIDEYRVQEQPNDLKRIVIGVDPAISSKENADEHGIVACGVAESGHGYVLEDASTKGTPEKWGRRAIALFDYYQADAIVIEKNQGGEMCQHVIDSIRPGIPVVLVHASRGKHVRAEPVSALYALGRIHHVKNSPQLEAQMCQVTAQGYEGEGSPDRVDALVWAMTELFPDIKGRQNVTNRPLLAEMEYDVSNYETNTYRGRQAFAIGE
jgi:PBSX family phage terminase large subunit